MIFGIGSNLFWSVLQAVKINDSILKKPCIIWKIGFNCRNRPKHSYSFQYQWRPTSINVPWRNKNVQFLYYIFNKKKSKFSNKTLTILNWRPAYVISRIPAIDRRSQVNKLYYTKLYETTLIRSESKEISIINNIGINNNQKKRK